MMRGAHFPTASAFALLALATFHLVSASDPSPLQDFCVAVNATLTDSAVFVNGKFCKDPIKYGNSRRFLLFRDEDGRKHIKSSWFSMVSNAYVETFPGLNTFGVSLARIDYAPNGGLNPPHIHPRATEVIMCVEGTIYVGFVTSNPDNRLFTEVLNAGEMFIFPSGMIHFQMNIGKVPAVAVSFLSSQFPGVIAVTNAVFGSDPPINLYVLTKAFQVDNNVVQYLQKQFWYDNNL